MSLLVPHLRDHDTSNEQMPLAVWSVQQRCAVDRIVGGRFAASYDFVPQYRLNATRWMADQMRKQGISLKRDDAPIWVFLDRPPSPDDPRWGSPPLGAEMRLLSLSIPRGRMLISFHYPWACHFLPTYPRLVLCASDADRADQDAVANRIDQERAEASWQKLFDLELLESPSLAWSNHRSKGISPTREEEVLLQATVPYLCQDDLVEILEIW